MSSWNYVVTAHKPTNVTHSCVGYFTNPQELNLIIAYPFSNENLELFSFGARELRWFSYDFLFLRIRFCFGCIMVKSKFYSWRSGLRF